MMQDGMPRALRERLGEAASEGLIQFLGARDAYMTEAIAEAVGQALEPRFAAIEAQLSQCVTQNAFDKRCENIERRFEKIDLRFEKLDDRFEKTDDRVTAFETRVMTKLDAQFLAIDTKLARVTHVQVGSIALFATFAAGLYLAFIAGL